MHLEKIRLILTDTLGLRQLKLDQSTPLLGSIPELDSMAVASVITALEEQFGFQIHDDEISARHFATLGTLDQFVQSKLA
jgi:acyl carrier protein